MKVYIVMWTSDSGESHSYKVFSTEQKAKECIAKEGKNDAYWIDELEIDAQE